MGEILGVMHPGVHYLPICGSVILKNKVTAPKIKWWNRPRMIITYMVSKGEKNGREKEPPSPKTF